MNFSLYFTDIKKIWKWAVPFIALALLSGHFLEILLILSGLFIFALGFKTLRKKWLIDNTPTSKVRSAAMGPAEFNGIALRKTELASRLTHTDCVYYKFRIEKEVRGSKGRKSWQIIESGESACFFYLEDTTGKILIDPLEAETFMPRDYSDIESKGFSRFRYSEWLIKPGDPVYVFGTVRKMKDTIADRKEKLFAKLRKLKEDRQKLAQFDTDKDGRLSAEEWDNAVRAAEEELTREEMNNPDKVEDELVVGKGDLEKTFILSDKKENQISRELLFLCSALVIIGILLAVAGSVSLIARAGLLPQSLIIPWINISIVADYQFSF
ncbi:MAG TPA: hypothetical protein DEE98_07500 [Elusimicrobia bacterium]|nr:hypothetical protein [Elusimicrobiota bacterium]